MTEQKRYAKVERKTNETQISVAIELDGEGKADIQTGVGFMDHMLRIYLLNMAYLMAQFKRMVIRILTTTIQRKTLALY
ncbi:Imidazoleglycerol-phosphate dehydratase [Lysinibacillus sphaericus]